ncbi:MAG: hypothetical protein EOP83_12565 [Verrucomicrobiaceae bacterium]|nr:MAG: hypothetical protein EOP83_12565 [Verrucomicrobiaceae bacterium]
MPRGGEVGCCPCIMSQDSSGGSVGWLIGIAVLAAAIYFWRISLALVGLAVVVGLLVWLGYRFLSKSGKAQTAMEGHDYAAALQLLQDGGDADQLISALRFKVPFPGETIKARVLAAVKELLALQDAATDPANPHLPAELRDEIGRRTRESLSSLWPLCQKLALVTRAKVKPDAVRERIEGVSQQLEELAANAETTRHQLAHLTLGATPLEIHEATEQVGAMKWQVGEMQRLDAMLEG